MENNYQRTLAQYYRQLEAVEKTFLNTPKTLKTDKVKTFLKYKSQSPLQLQKNKLEEQRGHQHRLSKLRINTKKGSLEIQNEQQQQTDEGHIKYLAELNESLISKNGMNNSTATKQQNQKIILEIQEHEKIDLFQDLLGHKKEQKNQILQRNLNFIQNRSQFIKSKPQNFYSEQCKQLIKNLVRRNNIYEKVKKHCKSLPGEEFYSFEAVWAKYQLYNKFVQKLNSLGLQM